MSRTNEYPVFVFDGNGVKIKAKKRKNKHIVLIKSLVVVGVVMIADVAIRLLSA